MKEAVRVRRLRIAIGSSRRPTAILSSTRHRMTVTRSSLAICSSNNAIGCFITATSRAASNSCGMSADWAFRLRSRFCLVIRFRTRRAADARCQFGLSAGPCFSRVGREAAASVAAQLDGATRAGALCRYLRPGRRGGRIPVGRQQLRLKALAYALAVHTNFRANPECLDAGSVHALYRLFCRQLDRIHARATGQPSERFELFDFDSQLKDLHSQSR